MTVGLHAAALASCAAGSRVPGLIPAICRSVCLTTAVLPHLAWMMTSFATAEALYPPTGLKATQVSQGGPRVWG